MLLTELNEKRMEVSKQQPVTRLELFFVVDKIEAGLYDNAYECCQLCGLVRA